MMIFSAEYAYHHYNELAKEKHPPAEESALLVAPTRLELVTQGSSGLCSTN